MKLNLEEYPLITIGTLIYNTDPRFVIEAIESIRTNNYPNIQHIIIDDFSPDPNPKRVVKEWIEKEKYVCEFYEHEENYGICKTLNHVLELARGKYICFCADDIFLPNKLITEVRALNDTDESYAATYGDAMLIDEQSNLKYGLFIQKYRSFEYLPDDEIFEILLDGNFLPAMSMIWKTDAIRDVGGYDENLKYEDYDLHLRLFKKYKIKLIDQVLSKYRIHGDGLVNNLKDWNRDLLQIYFKHRENKIAQQKIQSIVRFVISGSGSVNDLKKHFIRLPFFWFILKRIFFLNSSFVCRNALIYFEKLGLDLVSIVRIK